MVARAGAVVWSPFEPRGARSPKWVLVPFIPRGPRASVEGGDGGARTHWVETLRRRTSNHARARQDTLDLGEGTSLPNARTSQATSVFGTVVDITDLEDGERGQVRRIGNEAVAHHHERRGRDHLDRIRATNRHLQRGRGAHLRLDAGKDAGQTLDILLPARFREVPIAPTRSASPRRRQELEANGRASSGSRTQRRDGQSCSSSPSLRTRSDRRASSRAVNRSCSRR